MRILVVEDAVNVAAALNAGLAAEGFDVDIAHDGDTGLWLAREHDYSVILLDLMLPKQTGLQICSTLRAEGNDTPILMLTARSGDRDLALGLDTGADDYLAKPFSFVVLLARIRALLRRGSIPQTTQAITVGDLKIDSDSHQCRVADREVNLTKREFAVLEVLANRPGIVRSKQYLLDQVWGPEFEGSQNVVEVYVGYLRRKLDPDQPTKRIQTVPGHGYRMLP